MVPVLALVLGLALGWVLGLERTQGLQLALGSELPLKSVSGLGSERKTIMALGLELALRSGWKSAETSARGKELELAPMQGLWSVKG